MERFATKELLTLDTWQDSKFEFVSASYHQRRIQSPEKSFD